MQLEIRQDRFFNLSHWSYFALKSRASHFKQTEQKNKEKKNWFVRVPIKNTGISCVNWTYRARKEIAPMCVSERPSSFLVWVFSRWRKIKIELCHLTTEF